MFSTSTPRAGPQKFPPLNVGIALFCLVFIVVIWVAAVQRANFEMQQTVAAEMRQNANFAIALEEQSLKTFKNIDQALRFVVREFGRDGKAIKLEQILAASTLEPLLVNFLAVADENGSFVAGRMGATQVNARDREYFQYHQQKVRDDMFVGKPILGRISGKWTIPVSRRISKTDGSFGGIAVITLNPAFFNDLYLKTDLGANGILAVMGFDGIVRTRKIGPKTTFGDDLTKNARLRSIIAARQSTSSGNFIAPSEVDGIVRIFSFRIMQDYPLLVLVGTAEAEAVAPTRERQQTYYLIAAIVSAIIALFAIALMATLSRRQHFMTAAADSEDRFRSLLELSSDWWWEQDAGLKFIGISLNDPAPNSIPADRYTGLARWELPHTEPVNTTWDEHKSVLESRQPFRDLLLTRTGKDGKIHYITVNGKPIFDAQGNFKGYRGVGSDITAKMAADHALRESEESLRFVLESSRLGFWDRDLLNNKNMRSLSHDQMFGYAQLLPEWNFDTFCAHVHPEDRAYVKRANQNLMNDSGDASVEYRVIWPDKSVHWLWSVGRVSRDANGTTIRASGLVLDITDRKQADAALRDSEKRWKFALEGAGDAVWDWDVENGTEYVSSRWPQMLGYAEDEIGNSYESWEDRIHPEDRPTVLSRLKACVTGSTATFLSEHRVRCKDQSWKWILARGMVVERSPEGKALRMIGTRCDVNERKRAEAALRAGEERYRSVVDSMVEGVLVRDQHGIIIDCNASAERMFGETLSQLTGRASPAIGTISYAEDGTLIEGEMQIAFRVLRAGLPMSNFIEGLKKADGSMLWLSSSAQPLYDDAAKAIRGVVTTFADITERRRADELRMAKEAAELSSRTKSTFLSSMSHELRTPLNSILGFAQLLDYDPVVKAAKATQQKVHHILSAGRHLLAMVDDVLDLSRIEAGGLRLSLEAVETEQLVRECVTLILPEAERRRISFEFKVEQASSWVLGDRTRLRQVIANILSNAVKYNRIGGSVIVAMGGDSTRVIISIRDTGAGLSAQQIDGLFQPFNRLGAENSATEGTGIGLVIVKQLVLAMNGAIDVCSTMASANDAEISDDSCKGNATKGDHGSTFTMTFLRTAAADAAAPFALPPVPAPLSETPQGTFTVLCIEDNPTNAELVKQTLALNPAIRLAFSADGDSGLAAAAALRPDLILLDINLPGIDGYEVLQRLRTNPVVAHIACIAMTANAMSGEAQRARDAGFADYISKPFEVEVLLTKVSALLRRG